VRPTVYLVAHDPGTSVRLSERGVIDPFEMATASSALVGDLGRVSSGRRWRLLTLGLGLFAAETEIGLRGERDHE
jgi:hypothetical protein